MSRSTEGIETDEAAALVRELKEEDPMEPILVMRQEVVSFVESEGGAFANGTDISASNSTMAFASP
jgi:hypothetical protein